MSKIVSYSPPVFMSTLPALAIPTTVRPHITPLSGWPRKANEERTRFLTLTHAALRKLEDINGLASKLIKAKIYQRSGLQLDPDNTWLHFFDRRSSSHQTFNGWEYQHQPVNSLTLTEAVLKNFNASWQLALADDVDAQAGIYSSNSSASHFGTENEVRYLASQLREDIWQLDFQTQVTWEQAAFWTAHRNSWCMAARGEFIAQARLALSDASAGGGLSQQGFELVMSAAAPAITAKSAVTVAQLDRPQSPAARVKVKTLDINGYPSSQILRFSSPGVACKILYLPGEKNPFHEFSSEKALKQWVLEQAQQDESRRALEKYFSLYHLQDGSFYTGVRNGLKKLAAGEWATSAINTLNKPVTGDIFAWQAEQTRLRGISDADTLITSDAEVETELWRSYLATANEIFGPIAGAIGGPLSGIAAVAFVAQEGIQLHQAVAADTQAQRATAESQLTADTLMTLLFIGLLKAGGAEKSPSAVVAKNGIATKRVSLSVTVDGEVYRQIARDEYIKSTPESDGSFKVYSLGGHPPAQAKSLGKSAIVSKEGLVQDIVLRGGGSTVGRYRAVKRSESAALYDVFLLPKSLRAEFASKLRLDDALNDDHFSPAPALIKFNRLRVALTKQAQAYFEYSPTALTRPIPNPSEMATVQDVIAQTYAASPGMVLGEKPLMATGRRFLLDHLPALKKSGVTTLYLDQLQADMHQRYLDDFHLKGQMSGPLKAFLQQLDRPLNTDYSFERLIKQARRRGIRVVALDCAASYYTQGVHNPAPALRQKNFLWFASHVIDSHEPVVGKWVALVDHKYSNRYQGVPGLAELEGAVGIRLNDVPTGGEFRVARDKGEAGIKSDLVLY
ncbi:membrane-targeted effector domain-containing toxin [Pantoea sp. A4]|uniref:membrane-targeted effector domain-containing toxin n=1 Tax=Pantoea sp. A4 TaxID=1225184 RepID=UPI00035CBB4C|nr:membrane-targeted effector domain-containing toxin [Pantoea sp. A4]